MAARPTQSPARRAQRADAQRSIARLLDAAVEEFARSRGASMEAVAKRAGVARATLYAHFPSREALIDAVSQRAIEQAAEVLASASPEEGGPREALERVLAAAWQTLGPYHALVEINAGLAPERLRALHAPVLAQLRPLLERGQADGTFNPDLPLEWMLTVILDLIHAASREATRGRMSQQAAQQALIASVVGALTRD